MAEKLCVCPAITVAAAGAVDTETAVCGEGVTGGGSPAGVGECALELGTEAQPPLINTAERHKIAMATGAKLPARAPGSEFKGQILR